MLRRFVVGLSVLVAVFVGASSVSAGAQKVDLLNHALSNCVTGEQIGAPQPGFATINATATDIIAEVHLTGAPPDATYTVSLDQLPLQFGCVAPIGTLTTNDQGIGNAHIDVPLQPGATGAIVILRPANAAALPTGEIDSHTAFF